VVADIGAGTGFFSLPFARALAPNGHLYAVDFQAEMLALLTAKLQSESLPIETVLGSAEQTTLPAASCDLAFYANLWHELDEPAAVLAEAARLLRPGGRLAILDWRADLAGPPGPPIHHRVAQAQVEAALAPAWRLLDAVPFAATHYLLLATPA